MFKKIFASICILGSLLSGCTNNKFVDTNPMHRPYLNPGGVDFERDTKFFKSYNKLEGERKKRCETTYRTSNTTIVENKEKNELPGSILIGEQESKVLGRNDLNRMISKISGKKDQKWFKDNCVENKDLPDEIKELISNRCEAIMDEANINPNPSVPIIENSNKNCDTPQAVEYSSLFKKKKKVINNKKINPTKKKKYKKIDLCKQNDYEILSLDNIVNNCDKYSDKLRSKTKISYKQNLSSSNKKKMRALKAHASNERKVKIQNLDLG